MGRVTAKCMCLDFKVDVCYFEWVIFVAVALFWFFVIWIIYIFILCYLINHIFWIVILCQMYGWQTALPIYWLSLHWVVSLGAILAYGVSCVNCFYFLASGGLFRTSFPMPMSCRVRLAIFLIGEKNRKNMGTHKNLLNFRSEKKPPHDLFFYILLSSAIYDANLYWKTKDNILLEGWQNLMAK